MRRERSATRWSSEGTRCSGRRQGRSRGHARAGGCVPRRGHGGRGGLRERRAPLASVRRTLRSRLRPRVAGFARPLRRCERDRPGDLPARWRGCTTGSSTAAIIGSPPRATGSDEARTSPGDEAPAVAVLFATARSLDAPRRSPTPRARQAWCTARSGRRARAASSRARDSRRRARERRRGGDLAGAQWRRVVALRHGARDRRVADAGASGPRRGASPGPGEDGAQRDRRHVSPPPALRAGFHRAAPPRSTAA